MGALPIDRSAVAQGLRESRAVAFFGTWTIIGLFVDGWAHQANKPETFFTPWHGMLYSGFVAAVAWFAWDGRRSAANAAARPADRLTVFGLVAFVVGAVGDGVWHEIVGVEVDLEALLSPTHLLLMTGGILMLSAPVRWALTNDGVPDEPTFREFIPILVSLTLCASLVTFFTMYLGTNWPVADGRNGELGEVRGVAGVLVTNVLVLAPLLFARYHWRLPFGTCAVLMTANAVFMSALEGFRFPALIAPFVLGGVVADLVLAQRLPRWVFPLVVPLVTWSAYFAVHEIGWSVAWTIELWSGAIFLAAASAYGLDALLATSRSASTSDRTARLAPG